MAAAESESDVEQFIKMDAVQFGCQLMRNNSGALKDLTGRLVRYGLGNDSKARNDKIKSSDEIGFTRIVITPEMVGRTIAVFTAIEVKAPGWVFNARDKREAAQLAFIEWIRAAGGIAGFAESVDTFRNILRSWGVRV